MDSFDLTRYTVDVYLSSTDKEKKLIDHLVAGAAGDVKGRWKTPRDRAGSWVMVGFGRPVGLAVEDR